MAHANKCLLKNIKYFGTNITYHNVCIKNYKECIKNSKNYLICEIHGLLWWFEK